MIVIGNIFLDHKGNFQWISVTAWVSLVAAVLSFAGIIYGVIANRKTQKDIAQQQIDANLKAKARIEWIEKVRENTSNLVSALLTLQKKEDDFKITWKDGEKYSEILKLYFSTIINFKEEKQIYFEESGMIITEKAKKILYNVKGNDGKNQYIVEYIDAMMKIFNFNKYKNIKRRVVALNNLVIKEIEKQFSVGKIIQELVEVDEDGILMNYQNNLVIDPENENSQLFKEIEKKIDNYEREIKALEIKLNTIEDSVNEFTSIISLYLKLEWDKAKEGK